MCMVYLNFSRRIFLSRTHLPRSPTHIVHSRSQGDLSITNTPSLPPHASCPPCVPLDLCSLLARPLLDMCYRGVSLRCKQSHIIAIFMYLLALLFYIGDACVICSPKKRKTHSLSLIYRLLSLSLSHTYSFCTLTHSSLHALDLSPRRHSPRSIA